MSQSPSIVPENMQAPCPVIVPTILVEGATNVVGPLAESCILRLNGNIECLREQAAADGPLIGCYVPAYSIPARCSRL
jgi:hypothetical protein